MVIVWVYYYLFVSTISDALVEKHMEVIVKNMDLYRNEWLYNEFNKQITPHKFVMYLFQNENNSASEKVQSTWKIWLELRTFLFENANQICITQESAIEYKKNSLAIALKYLLEHYPELDLNTQTVLLLYVELIFSHITELCHFVV